ncbi:MAG TPA: NF038122 family metalloprotease [Chthoniobacterales bacterium]
MKSTTSPRARAALWAILVLAFTAGGTASALNINLSYDPDATFLAAGLTAADIVNMKSAAAYSASQFTSRCNDPIDVNIKITAVSGTGTLGMSSTFINSVASYAALRAAMVNDSTSPDDATVLAAGGSLPAADPIGGAHMYIVSRAEAKALGFIANDLSNDGTFTFGSGFSYTYDPANRAVAGKIDFIGVAMHELSEIMGRIGVMGQNITGQADYVPLDLFHYTGAGVRGLNNGAARSFSINNGTTLLKAFNNAAANGGDLQDWASGTNDSFNAFSNSGVQNDLTAVDIRVMDVIGYNLGSGAPTATGAVSRLTHGGAGPFDVALPLTGTAGVECRSSSTYNIVFTFNNGPITSGTAMVTSGTGMAGTPTFSGSTMMVPLTLVTNAQRLTLTVSSVNGVGSASVTIGFLIGDTNGDGLVNAADIGQTKSQSGNAVTGSNFREDVTVDGLINASDVGLVKSKSGTALP